MKMEWDDSRCGFKLTSAHSDIPGFFTAVDLPPPIASLCMMNGGEVVILLNQNSTLQAANVSLVAHGLDRQGSSRPIPGGSFAGAVQRHWQPANRY